MRLMDKELRIPGDKTCEVASKLNRSIGFVCDRAEQEFDLHNGSTALFWHLVAIVAEHVKPKTEDKHD